MMQLAEQTLQTLPIVAAIRARQRALKITDSALSEATGIQRAGLQRIWNGLADPRTRQIDAIARALDTTMLALFTEAEHIEAQRARAA